MVDDKLSDFEKDALKEVGNIGSGNASTRLSEYVNEKVDLELTQIRLVNSKSLSDEYLSENKKQVVSVFVRVSGDAIGSVITLFEKEFAVRIMDIIDKKPLGSTKAITSECEDKFRVIGESLADSYISSLVTFLNQDLKQSRSIVQINDKGIVMKFMLKGISPYIAEDVLILQTRFNIKKYSLNGEFILIFGLKSLDSFKEAIKNALGQA